MSMMSEGRCRYKTDYNKTHHERGIPHMSILDLFMWLGLKSCRSNRLLQCLYTVYVDCNEKAKVLFLLESVEMVKSSAKKQQLAFRKERFNSVFKSKTHKSH